MADPDTDGTRPGGRPTDKAPGLEAPTFDAPWQAEAFALTVALNEAGLLPWSDWAQAFGAELARRGLGADAAKQSVAALANDARAQAEYYRAWVATLESLCRDQGWVGPLQLTARRETLRAYTRVAEGGALFSTPPDAGQ